MRRNVMRVYGVTFPEGYEELAKQVEEISIQKHQSISWTIRDMLCIAANFTPQLEKEIIKRDTLKNKTRKA